MQKSVVVIPCYNEAGRLDQDEFKRLADTPGVSLIFVDDGSTDATSEMLDSLVQLAPEQMSLLALSPNQGKGEAVRRGMLQALDESPGVIAFIDADLATPVDEVVRLLSLAHEGDADALLGSRIRHLGHDIDRKLARHLLGRVFATAASLALEAPVYDTQCGAKFFRVSDTLHQVLEEKFHSRWAFDVELIGRLMAENATILEVPLKRWVDVPGSKISFRSMIKAGADLVQIRSRLKRRKP